MGKKAVVLSGGGAKGGYQIGVWKVLRQMGFTPDIVVGTSVGALNGALMALDNFDAALDIWENMSMDSVFQNFVKQIICLVCVELALADVPARYVAVKHQHTAENIIERLLAADIFERDIVRLAELCAGILADVPEDKARRSFHRRYSRGQSRRLCARERGGVPVHEVI